MNSLNLLLEYLRRFFLAKDCSALEFSLRDIHHTIPHPHRGGLAVCGDHFELVGLRLIVFAILLGVSHRSSQSIQRVYAALSLLM